MAEGYEGLAENEVVLRAQAGENEAVELLLGRYKNMVHSTARAYFIIGAEQEDLLQEGMIGLFKAIRDYDAGKGQSFFAFAQLCVRRQMITALKNAARQKHMPLNSYISLDRPIYGSESENTLLDVLQGGDEDNPEHRLISKQDRLLIGEKIERLLSDFEKQVLEGYLAGESYQQTAQRLGAGVKSVDNALQRVKKKLERALHALL